MTAATMMLAGGGGPGIGASWTNSRALSAVDVAVGVYRDVTAMAYGLGYYMVFAYSRVARSTNLTNWTYCADVTVGPVVALVYGGGKFVGITNGGANSVCSTNSGVSWTIGYMPAGNGGVYEVIYDGCYNGSMFVACGKNSNIYTSTDGINWTHRSGLYTALGNSNHTIQSIAWTGTRFVATVSSYKPAIVAYSTDAITWTISTAPQTPLGGGTSFGYTLAAAGTSTCFMRAIDSTGTEQLIISTDSGATWSNYFTPTGASGSTTEKVATDGTAVVIYHLSKTNYKASSGSSVVTYTPVSADFSAYPYVPNQIYASTVGFLNGTMVLGSGEGGLRTSTNGSTWTAKPNYSGIDTYYSNVAVGALATNGTDIIACGHYGRIAKTTVANIDAGNKATFVSATLNGAAGWGSSDTIYAAIWDGSRYIVAGGAGKVATSSDGTSWTYQTGLRSTAWGAAGGCTALLKHGASVFVFGSSGKVASTSDGAAWTYHGGLISSGWGTADVLCATTNGTTIVVGGTSGHIATSTDGVNWFNQTGLSSTDWSTTYVNDVSWSSELGLFVAVGDAGKVATSADGEAWVTRTSGTFSSLYAVTFTKGYFVAVGSNQAVIRSKDGATWEAFSLSTLTDWGSESGGCLTVVGSRLVVGGTQGRLATSK